MPRAVGCDCFLVAGVRKRYADVYSRAECNRFSDAQATNVAKMSRDIEIKFGATNAAWRTAQLLAY
jgi:hypothetical protein